MRSSPHLIYLLFFLPSLTLAWICYPPPHLLPTRFDCVALILGLDYMSRQPADIAEKDWGRALHTGPRTEQLPRWYYLVDERNPPASCALMVDAGGANAKFEVGRFSLADVVDAAQVVYSQCLVEKGNVGLEFPGERPIFVKMVRFDGVQLERGDWGGKGKGEVRRVDVPGGTGRLLVVGTGDEPGRVRNGTTVS